MNPINRLIERDCGKVPMAASASRARTGMTCRRTPRPSRRANRGAGVLLAVITCLLGVSAAALAAGPARPLTLDTHVDIPNPYMREARFDAGGDSVLQVDLNKMQRGGLDAAFLVIYVDQGPLTPQGYAAAMEQAERKYSAIEMLLAQNPDRARLALSPQDIHDNQAQGRLSIAIGIENGYSLGHDLARLDAAFARGARYLGLVHVGNNDLCSSSMPDVDNGEPAHNSAADAGMSAFGRAAVARANALGMMVDVSHASDRCVREALALSRAPIIASHSSARALIHHPRNLPDELLRAIAARGGVIQAVAYKQFLKDDPARYAAEEALEQEVVRGAGDTEYDSDTHDYLPAMAEGMAQIEREHPLANLDDYMAHIQHLVDVAGIDHVGLASDFDGGGGITGWMDASQTANVTAALRAHGFSEADIAKLWSGNLLRVWQAAIDVARNGQGGNDANAATAAVVDRLVQETIERYDLPGIAVGVVENGVVSVARGYGETVAGSGEKVDRQTLFKIASNTKAMTVALLARLVDRGDLRWDDLVIKHLPQFRMHDAWVTQNFQLRDLLIHNSGLGLGAGDLMLWPEPNDFTRADLLAGLAHLKPVSSFRSRYAYDNLLYIVAGELAATVAGDTYENALRAEVFQPLGLTRCQVGEFSRSAVANIAQPHRRTATGNVATRRDGDVIPAITSAAAGGVRCSLDDMLVWMQNWLDPGLSSQWLSHAQRSAITSPHMPMPISERQRRWENLHFHAYGYGVRLSDPHGQFRFGHTGTLDGMYSALAMFPDRRSGYVFLINGEAGAARTVLETALTQVLTGPTTTPDIKQLAQELDDARAASGADEARAEAADRNAVAPKTLGEALGIYEDAWFGEIRLCPTGRRVQWASAKSPRMHGVVMQANGRLLVAWEDPGNAGADAWLELGRDAAGAPNMSMRAIDPETDFSYDFHDLAPHRVRSCD